MNETFAALALAALLVIAAGAVIIIGAALGPLKRKRSSIGYTPRGDRVIVKRSERPAQKDGDVFLPDSQQRPLDEGLVIAVGPEVPDIKAGDHVCFVEFAGANIEVDGESYLTMREMEIHGKRG